MLRSWRRWEGGREDKEGVGEGEESREADENQKGMMGREGGVEEDEGRGESLFSEWQGLGRPR